MSDFSVEHGIPLPPHRRRRKYPLLDMAPGQSFFVATEEGRSQVQTRNSVASTISAHVRKNGGKFVSRIVDGGVRVWCVERSHPVAVLHRASGN